MSIHYKDWKTISSNKYILGIVKRGLALSFNKDKSGKPPFKYPRTNRK